MIKTGPSLPRPIKDVILKILGEWNTSTVKTERLRKQMRKLSKDLAQQKFTEEKNEQAYFAYHFPINFMKANIVFRSVLSQYNWPVDRRSVLNICDLGCGNGAGLLGAYNAVRDLGRISIYGIDKSRIMIKSCYRAIRILKSNDPNIDFRLINTDVNEYFTGKNKELLFDFILISNSLLELFPKRTPLNFIRKLFARLNNGGMIICIEPALKSSFNLLMQFRTAAIEKFNARILLPCLHEQDCPVSAMPDEWCHQSIPWQPPEYLRLLNKGLNREIDVLKFSVLVMSKGPVKRPEGYRVISSLLKEKGKMKCFLCSAGERIQAYRLDRDRSDLNSSFGQIKKGNIIEITSAIRQKPHVYKITEQTCIQVSGGISV